MSVGLGMSVKWWFAALRRVPDQITIWNMHNPMTHMKQAAGQLQLHPQPPLFLAQDSNVSTIRFLSPDAFETLGLKDSPADRPPMGDPWFGTPKISDFWQSNDWIPTQDQPGLDFHLLNGDLTVVNPKRSVELSDSGGIEIYWHSSPVAIYHHINISILWRFAPWTPAPVAHVSSHVHQANRKMVRGRTALGKTVNTPNSCCDMCSGHSTCLEFLHLSSIGGSFSNRQVSSKQSELAASNKEFHSVCACACGWNHMILIIQLLMYLNARMCDFVSMPCNFGSFKTQHQFLLICSLKRALHLHWLATLHLIFPGGFFPATSRILLLARKIHQTLEFCCCVVIEHHRIDATTQCSRERENDIPWHQGKHLNSLGMSFRKLRFYYEVPSATIEIPRLYVNPCEQKQCALGSSKNKNGYLQSSHILSTGQRRHAANCFRNSGKKSLSDVSCQFVTFSSWSGHKYFICYKLWNVF